MAVVTTVGFEVVYSDEGVQFNRKYPISLSCVCDDDHGGGQWL